MIQCTQIILSITSRTEGLGNSYTKQLDCVLQSILPAKQLKHKLMIIIILISTQGNSVVQLNMLIGSHACVIILASQFHIVFTSHGTLASHSNHIIGPLTIMTNHKQYHNNKSASSRVILDHCIPLTKPATHSYIKAYISNQKITGLRITNEKHSKLANR